ncbi:hypothetical protein [Massilia sp. CF038]|uniref:hypothetical protein n=1 Tax=Massilia sp. CF038 TaxID=1881045 RepID=UPI000917AC25|nr:hypothetical protein [Massilia sp. CF038]SHG71355.1 hypothetical protein SAMN05428948_1729 [Massilia sp. CF038]
MQKQLFYLTNQELVAYAWQGKALTRIDSYNNDDEGRRRLGAYLEHAESVPSYLLVDVIEEDFQRDTAPHVSGRAREALLERKLLQLYRDTPYRQATLQGRDKEGRKDDRYLFNALTNPELPRSWLLVMQKQRVPLVGIYSLASLSQLLFDKLKLGSGAVLLVSHQSSGLRQSFFQDGALRFSRLTPLFDHAPERLAEAFRVETAKTRQFMANSRLLARGVQVQVVVLARQDNLTALAGGMQGNAEVSYLPIDLEQARTVLRSGQFDTSAECDPLTLSLLASTRVPSHFPLRDLKHFYQLLQARLLLYGLSGAVALAAVVWAALDVNSIFALRREEARLDQEAAATEQRYQQIVKNMPVTQVSPHNMKSVVELAAMLDNNVPLPNAQMAQLSAVLNGIPEIKVTKLTWNAVEAATLQLEVDPNAPPPGPLEDFSPPPGLLGMPDKTAQTVLLEGEIVPFKGDYRAAIDSVARFAAQLNRNRGVHADVTLQPLDTRPGVKLEKSAGAEDGDGQAVFTLKITWKP